MHLVKIALFGWVPVVLCLFAVLPPRRAIIVAFIGGWLFLPMYAVDVVGLPPFSKVSASAYAVMLAVVLFDAGRLVAFRPRWFDLPVTVWVTAPLFASLSNGLGWYDGLTAVLSEVVLWGIPYLLGRLYFADWEGIRELAIGVFVGGLIYVPLCLFEMRASPVLHKWTYGYLQNFIPTAYRFGGWRPIVYMQSGLAVAMWMASASLIGLWLWMSGSLRSLGGMPMSFLVPVLLLTTILCKSAGSWILLAMGMGTLIWVRLFKNALPLVLIILSVPAYVTLRASQLWTGNVLVGTATTIFNAERAASLQFRLNAEDKLAAKALQQPAFGWGRWKRSRVYDEKGRDVAITDGLWVIAFGTTGMVGLGAIMATILMPPLLYRSRCPARFWDHPMGAAGAVLGVILTLHMLDNLWNAMLNPVYVLVIGALTGLGATAMARTPQPARAVPMNAAPPRRVQPMAAVR